MNKEGTDNLNREDRFKTYTHQVRVFYERIIDTSFLEMDQAIRILIEFGNIRDINSDICFLLD